MSMQGGRVPAAGQLLVAGQSAQAGQQMNLAAVPGAGAPMTLPPGTQLVKLPTGQLAIMSSQQIQQLLQLQQAQLAGGGAAAAAVANNALLGGMTGAQNAQMTAITALQQRLQANPAGVAAPGAAGRQPVQQASLLAGNKVVQQQPATAGRVPAVPAAPPVKLTNNFTDDQLTTLREQIVLFKCIKKNTAPVGQQELAVCRPKSLPVQLLAPSAPLAAQQQPAAGTAAAHPAGAGVGSAMLQQQQLRPQANLAAASLAAQQQQQQIQRANLAAVAAAAQRPGGAATAAGRPGQQRADGAAGSTQQQQQQQQEVLGPTTPPMEEPVRRYGGPLLGMLPPQEVQPNAGAPPSLNVDVPRLLLKEYHHRVQRAKMRRQHELEQLLQRKDLPIGHGRAADGLPGRAAVMLELRKLKLWNVQLKVRGVLEREQEEISQMQDRNYRQLQKSAAKYKQTLDMAVQQRQHERWDRLVNERVQYKKVVADRFVMFRDMHLARNKQLSRLHERLAREFNKQRMDDNDRRLEALKANDFEAYKELLRQTYGPSTDDERFAEVERFLTETEEYINKLTKKLVQYKAEEQAGEAVQEAIAEARMLELTEEEVKMRAEAAQQQHMATNELLTQVHTLGGDAQTRFTQLAHNIREKVIRQPAYLKPPKGGKLREYQMVGLEWMLSLYNNKLNGILADEMGLGKTVQVMALLAYLYEFKQNYGPHLIIVPNAVIVNWKAELHTWLPDFRCVYYTGSKDERAVKFQQEVQSMQFNILVTTYETIMRDRSKLSKLEWKYIIIDEAQRMKDRESKLSQDLNKFTTARRLLLTGTPLQNELKELWSLLNLLLPDVFNDSNTFSEWFTRFLGVDSFGDNGGAAGDKGGEAAALDREKKILVVNRLHQILSPFMLRRMVKDVEQQLPEKVTITIKCPMSAYQSAIYNWIKTTNTIRVDPQHRRAAHGMRAWEPLQNKVMELRKVCNHPQLCYQRSEHFWSDNVVRTCGKMFWLDRMLVKLHRSGHRVLLFSTMTKMLDTVEFYLSWRQVDALDGSGRKVLMQRRRIDGSTTLEERERAIQEFNRPHTDVFIFLLSIRAAGRGLNLQTSDTVIIYDPDPNPKNEEQAIARSHRIGQTKEVRVFHMEAIADPAESFPPPYYQPRRADIGSDGDAAAAAADDLKGDQHPQQHPQQQQQQQQQQQHTTRFADSIESLMRNIIQKQKIDMANEVIDAGRFDMQTTNEERRKTLEEMLLDEDRLQTATNEAPTLESFNRQLARNSAEFDLFQQMDREYEWPGELVAPQEVPDYLLYTAEEAREVLQITDRRPAKIGMLATAERRALQGQAGNDSGTGRGRGRGSKPPKPSRLGAAGPAAAAPGGSAAGVQFADQQQQQQQQQQRMPAVLSYSDLAGGGAGPSGMKTSQSVASFPGATSMASGLGEDGDGEEEVVGGAGSAFEDIEEEVVDDQNIDEEFEKVLEQEDGRGRSITPGSTGRRQQQQQQTPGSSSKPSQVEQGTPQDVSGIAAGRDLEGGPAAVDGAAAGTAEMGGSAADDQQQQYQYWSHEAPQQSEVHKEGAAGSAAGSVSIETAQQLQQQHDAAAAAQPTAAGFQPVKSEPGWPGGLDVQEDWEDVQKQHQQVSGMKRSWAQLGTVGGSNEGGSAAVGGAAAPSLSGPGTSASAGAGGAPSSQGGFKRIKLKLGAQKSEPQ